MKLRPPVSVPCLAVWLQVWAAVPVVLRRLRPKQKRRMRRLPPLECYVALAMLARPSARRVGLLF
jgi:hypothetical protein